MAMHSRESSLVKQNLARDISVDGFPFIRKYKDGSIERLLHSPFVPASAGLQGSNRGVATRDVVVDKASGASARLFLPYSAAEIAGRRRLPLVVYVHGGAFCTESAFGRTYHRYATSLAASAGAIVVSVEYRLAPEFPIPAAYDDAWTALKWAAFYSDPWLADYADPARTFLAGDSAGGNIVYHTAVRASHNDMVNIEGLIMVQPYFWGPQRLPCELEWEEGIAMLSPSVVDRLWPFVTMGVADNDDPLIDPPTAEIASLACRRVLVAVAGKDTLRGRGLRLADDMRDYSLPWMVGNRRDVTVVESEGEDHGFHLYSPLRATSKRLMQSIVHFVNKPISPPAPMMPTTPFMDVFGYGYGMAMKSRSTSPAARSSTMALNNNSFKLEGDKKSYRSFLSQMQRTTTQKGTLSAGVQWKSVIKNF